MASILRQVFSNRNVLTISSTNMLYHIFNSLWELWWTLYLIEELKTPITIVGFLATIQNTSSILFQLPGGIIADRIGRKRVIVFGTGMRIVAPLFLLTAKSWHWVVPGMVLNSIASIYVPAFNAIIAESLPQERRGAAFGAYRMLTSIPQIFMPVVSGFYLDQMGIAKGVEADMMENFGPVMDVGPGSRMGFLDKKIAQSVMMGLSKEKRLEFDMKGRNDLRDWDRIRDFAHRFAESLQ